MYAEYWNFIVSEYKTKQYAQESTIQAFWENYFSEMFNYKKFLKEIDSQRTITIGSGQRVIPDIILRRNNQDVVDVELKRYGLPFSSDMEDQLFSYMNQLHISVGVLVCQKIYVYVYDYVGNKKKKLGIPFEKNNPDGIKFVELFQKDNFSKDAIEEFIDSKHTFGEKVEEIKSKISEELIFKLLREYFGKEYTSKVIEAAIENVQIKVEIGPPPSPPHRRYRFEGNWYPPLNHLPLDVVKAYVRDNPNVTYSELEDRFPKELQGSYGVFLTREEASLRTTDLRKRFFVDHPIILGDNSVILVSTQWGDSGSVCNIAPFIRRATFLGYKIDVINTNGY